MWSSEIVHSQMFKFLFYLFIHILPYEAIRSEITHLATWYYSFIYTHLVEIPHSHSYVFQNIIHMMSNKQTCLAAIEGCKLAHPAIGLSVKMGY